MKVCTQCASFTSKPVRLNSGFICQKCNDKMNPIKQAIKEVTTRDAMYNVKEAIKVILSDKAKYATSLNYAINYCKHALTIDDPHEMKIQTLYILNNISGWRHPEAKSVRTILKAFK